MAGIKGRSGRKRKDTLRFRPVITLQPGLDDKLIEFFSAIPCRYQGEAIKIALRNGGLDAGRDAAATIATQEAIMAAQERAEIEGSLSSLGDQWDNM